MLKKTADTIFVVLLIVTQVLVIIFYAVFQKDFDLSLVKGDDQIYLQDYKLMNNIERV